MAMPGRDHADAVVALHELPDYPSLELGGVVLLLGHPGPFPCPSAQLYGVSP